MTILILLLLVSISFGLMLHSVYVLGKGGMYPPRRTAVKRVQISGGAFIAAAFLLLGVWLI